MGHNGRVRGFGGGGGSFTQVEADGLYIPKSLVDAKGDLLTATADNTPARLAVGTDGYGLTAWSNATTGLGYVHQGGVLKGAAGLWDHAPIIPVETNPATARIFYHPIILRRRTTYDRIAAYHNSTTGGGGSTCELGVYSNNASTDWPDARLFTAGTIALDTAAAFKTITISQTLDPGLYWRAACIVQTGNPRMYCLGTTNTSGDVVISFDKATNPTAFGGCLFESGSSLPVTATPSTVALVVGPLVYMRIA